MGSCHCGAKADDFYMIAQQIDIKLKEMKKTKESLMKMNIKDLTNPEKIQKSGEKLEELKNQVDTDFKNLDTILNKQKKENPKDNYTDKEKDQKRLKEDYAKIFEVNENEAMEMFQNMLEGVK